MRSRILRMRALGTVLLGLWCGDAAATETLQAMILEASGTHPSVLGERARVDSAESAVGEARWQFYPTPSISLESVNAGASDPDFQGDEVTASVRLTQPLWAGGRLRAGLRRAKAELAGQTAAVEISRMDIALRVVQAYGNWLAAELKSQAWRKSIATHERLRDQVARRTAQGVSTESDLALARGRLESNRADAAVCQA